MQPAKSKTRFAETLMNNPMKDRHPELKQAQHHVFNELLKRGVLPHRAADGRLWANTLMGRRLELRVATSTGSSAEGKQRFSVPDFRPRPELIFLCVEISGGEIETVWVLPSTVFLVYSAPHKADAHRELNLDAKQERCLGRPFREYNSFFRNRWEPVAYFDRYRRYMKPWDAPDFADGWENFEDLMMMLEADENWEPESDSITSEEYAAELVAALPD